ncbi:MAG TPA: cbb3-type cytochrome c oxidase subunit 3 [Rubrivivax sp.]|jgi:cytochrome c oxidase cbb3-type subunit 4|nr:cbb3-type cytochrome c oxidase subunit 3 [Rubrivivax sp.]
MDVNDLRIATTISSFVLFVGIVAWAWSKNRRAGFHEAANLPFVETDARNESAGVKQ